MLGQTLLANPLMIDTAQAPLPRRYHPVSLLLTQIISMKTYVAKPLKHRRTVVTSQCVLNAEARIFRQYSSR